MVKILLCGRVHCRAAEPAASATTAKNQRPFVIGPPDEEREASEGARWPFARICLLAAPPFVIAQACFSFCKNSSPGLFFMGIKFVPRESAARAPSLTRRLTLVVVVIRQVATNQCDLCDLCDLASSKQQLQVLGDRESSGQSSSSLRGAARGEEGGNNFFAVSLSSSSPPKLALPLDRRIFYPSLWIASSVSILQSRASKHTHTHTHAHAHALIHPAGQYCPRLCLADYSLKSTKRKMEKNKRERLLMSERAF